MNTSSPSIATKDDASGPLADVVFDRVLEAIYQGRLAPGSVINEVALAQEFGVSRGPVREAVRRLQGIQLVTREPYIKARVVTLSAESALELFQMRMALEGVACNLATRRMSDEEIAQLLAELEQDRQRRLEAATGGERIFDFHERIVLASGNTRIINALCGDLYHLLRVYRRHSGTVLERKDDAYAEHWQILRAIRARDAELAESLMRSHIERAAQHLFEHLAEGASGIAGHPVPAV
ncbi:GntR family transcriptional regulator [Bordetella avium]|uniref:GntR-family transcriptional regulator n=1 Tax=Bordetella avium (strain 197N) TaxID=360910 RepID=Q2KXP3_BORA1|nr:GntR family transcriptional regulator [Bordetella avium]AZY48179.1 GntR family transcriptional regulator [Bordetella avium]AZY51559.1 GntR family transcriptional regulator [Bordetella avium]RIQ14587.1 GntR family transcriptional regulator [Bordetella avium]RIQ16697.1 GntR family transcriptional regulator [Bordetella avium]RIQ35031.1 GntR family transcriptional regulator [Bordetella avium]